MTAPDSTLPLFCFGSLMDDEVLGIVTALDPAALRIERAIARDLLPRVVASETYPVLIPAPGARTGGRLVHGLDARALDRVLFFEGEEYALADIVVEVDDIPCRARFFRDSGTYRTAGIWDFERWRRNEHAVFVERTARYMALYGTMSVAEADVFWTRTCDERA